MTGAPIFEQCIFDARTARMEVLRSAFDKHGVVKLTEAFPGSLMDELRTAAMHEYSKRDRMFAAGLLPQELKASYVRRTIMLDSLRGAQDIPFAELLSRGLARELACEVIGKDVKREPNSFMRTIIPGPDDQRLPFHQDETILKRAVVNVWIALTPCGIDAPGLELAVSGRRELLEPVANSEALYAVEKARLAEEDVVAIFGTESLWHPGFEVGDVVIFAGTTVHRTYITPAMTHPRLSAELRFV